MDRDCGTANPAKVVIAKMKAKTACLISLFGDTSDQTKRFKRALRCKENPDSDIDFLIDVTAETSPWFPIGLIQDLEKLLGRRVEIVTERTLNKDLRERVLREAVPV